MSVNIRKMCSEMCINYVYFVYRCGMYTGQRRKKNSVVRLNDWKWTNK